MTPQSIHSQVSANKNKSWLIMVLFILFLSAVVYVFGRVSGYGVSIAFIAFLISGIFSIGSYYYSDKLILSLSGASEADRKKDFDLYTAAENIAISAGLPKPRVYVIEDSALNAFATGRDPKHAVICVTRGLVDKLDRRELEGVIAHEMSHVKNFDTRLMSVVAVLVGMLVYLSDWFLRSIWYRGGSSRKRSGGRLGLILLIIGIVLALITPLIATLIQLAISRRREYLADGQAALLTRYPEGLARALEKITDDKEVLEAASNATAHLYITNPFKNKQISAWFSGLFNTHPPVEERIKILRGM